MTFNSKSTLGRCEPARHSSKMGTSKKYATTTQQFWPRPHFNGFSIWWLYNDEGNTTGKTHFKGFFIVKYKPRHIIQFETPTGKVHIFWEGYTNMTICTNFLWHRYVISTKNLEYELYKIGQLILREFYDLGDSFPLYQRLPVLGNAHILGLHKYLVRSGTTYFWHTV